MKKKTTRRNTVKNSAIDPYLNLKSRSEELGDIQSYFHNLPPDAQKFMLKYTENVVNASFDRKIPKKNLITPTYIKNLLELYLFNFKKKDQDKKVINFIKKYLIRSDNIPIDIIQELFVEENDTKILKLVKKLKSSLYANLKNVKKNEIYKVIKLIEKEVYGINNARNRCIVTREKAGGSLSYIEDMSEDEVLYNYEDALVAKIDNQTKLSEESDYFDDGNRKNRNTSNSSK